MIILPNDRDVGVLEVLVRTILAVCFVALVAGAFGCGGPPRVAQQALSATAEGIAGADVLVAERAAQAAVVARESAREIADFEAALAVYDVAMRPWVMLERVLLEAKGALLALQAAHDAWVVGASDGQRRWLEAVACGVPILLRVSEALLRADVAVPPKLTRALSLLVAFAEARCPEPEPETTR